VGRHVVAALREAGQEVVVLARRAGCDLVKDPVPEAALRGAGAIVNLVGIKREQGAQTVEAVHVGVTARLIAAARAAGVRRFVHVSVVCSRPDPRHPYHDSKWRAEELLRASGLDVTVLRPAVIHGPGDDMVSHLVKMIRCAPLFPVVGRGEALLQPVDVRDVAAAVVAALRRPRSIGGCYDVVGPERLTLRRVVETVAGAVGLRLWILPTPPALLRPVVAAMSAFSARALSTPAQLTMLQEGLVGDPEPARRDLGLEPRPFSADGVRAVEGGIRPLFGLSLRLVPDRAHAKWLDGLRSQFPRAAALAVLAVALLPALGFVVPGVWERMAVNAAVLVPLALFGVRLPWRALFTPSWRGAGAGLLAAGVLYAAGALVAAPLLAVPAVREQVAALYSWRAAAPPGWTAPLLLWIVLGEEVVWRAAVTLPLAARLGAVRGVLLAGLGFAAAHLSLGVPLLLVVALGAGAFWSALVVRARGAVPALVSHLLWDVMVLFLWPYARVP
jgi:NADH dehydrogenase